MVRAYPAVKKIAPRDKHNALLLGAALLAPAAGAQQKPLLIGQSAALTGSQAEFGREIRDGVLAAFRRINAGGGVQGRPIELVTLDDAGNDARAKDNSAQLIKQHNVLALFGYISRPSSVAGAKIASEARVPFIGPFSGTPALCRFDRYVFTIRASYDDELASMVKQIVTNGYKRIGFAYLNDARQVNVPLVEKLLAEHGLKPAVLVGLDRASGVASVQAAELAEASPDVLLALANNLPLAEGLVFAQIVPLPTRRTSRIVKEYQRDYSALFPGTPLSFTSLEGYIAGRALGEGLRRGGAKVTRESLVQALESMQDFDLGDFFINFSSRSHNASRFVDLTIVNRDGQFLN